jgi:hypothetical protein
VNKPKNHTFKKLKEKSKMQKKELSRERKIFKQKGFAVKSYADAKGFCYVVLSKVLDGQLNGKAKPRAKNGTRAVIEALKVDGIWTKPTPWIEEGAK